MTNQSTTNHEKKWKPDDTAFKLYELIAEIPYPEQGYDAMMIAEDAHLPLSTVRGRLKTMAKHGMIRALKDRRRLTYWPMEEDVQ